MKLVVGLGNPGRKYRGTRHNVGFAVLGELARRFGAGAVKSKFNGEFVEVRVGPEQIVLLSPLTFMNRSGASVQAAKAFYKLEGADLLVVCDDLNLPLGKLRLRIGGSSGGQKGLDDIVRQMGSEDFPRLRIGIGSPPENWDWADYVLSKFSKEEIPHIENAVSRAADAVTVWVSEGVESGMNQFN